MRTTLASDPSVARRRSSAPAPDSSVDTRRDGSELCERDPGERLGRIGEHAEPDALRCERLQGRAGRGVAAKVTRPRGPR